MEINYLDLFSGIGGFALGAYWAGMKFNNHYASEVDKYAVDLYQKRFPDSIQLGDITKINCDKLPKGEWIITGGFPCQDISVAGKGVGIEGERSGLWFTYADIISKLRPRYAIMENVGALTIRGLDAVLSSLTEIGYSCEWQDIRAEDMGAPHRRERIWIVAYPSGRRWRESKNAKVCRDGLSDSFINSSSNEKLANANSSRRKIFRGIWKQGTESRTKKKAFNKHRTGDRENPWTIEPDVGRLANGVSNRVDRLKGIGNSIVPQIAELLFNRIKFL